MRRIFVIIFFIVVLSLSTLIFSYNKELKYTKNTVYINDIQLEVEIADTQKKRIIGLSGRKNLDEKNGMLFVFDEENLHKIWMKDMGFPIDILWLNNDLNVVDIEEQVKPSSYPEVFIPDVLSRYVFEVNSGFVRDNNIKIGDKIIL